MSPAMPSSWSRCSASRRSPSRMRSPALSSVAGSTMSPPLGGGDELLEVVALGRGVLGVAADVEVEPGTVAEEHVARAAPAHDLAEEVAGDLVGAQPALPLERA